MEEDRYDKIEQYAKGELTGKDLEVFEQQMLADQELADEVDDYKSAVGVFEIKGTLAEVDASLEANFFFDKLDLSKLEEKEPTQEGNQITKRPVGRIRMISLLAYAATILLLVAIGSLVYSKINYADQALASSIYEDPDLSNGTKNAEAEKTSLKVGLDAYYSGNFSEAADIFSAFSEEDLNYYQAQYGLAHSYFKQENYEAAANVFQKIINQTPNTELREEAEWYLALSYLSNGDTGANFTSLMDKLLGDQNHRYHVFARQLKASLNSFWHRLAGVI